MGFGKLKNFVANRVSHKFEIVFQFLFLLTLVPSKAQARV
jgi:hypothetical protein